MEEKKTIKISISTVLLIIAIVIIVIMGYFLYSANSKVTEMLANEKELNTKIERLNNEIANKREDIKTNLTPNNVENETKIGKSFSETMDMLYTKKGTKIGEITCDNNYPQDRVYMQEQDASEKVINVEYTSIEVYDEGISFNMKKANSSKEISTAITGITEEVVSIKILAIEAGGTPSKVCFLTRNGNVYYIDENMINANNFVAKKLDNVSEVVSIEKVEVTYADAMELSPTIIATTYSGEKMDLFE